MDLRHVLRVDFMEDLFDLHLGLRQMFNEFIRFRHDLQTLLALAIINSPSYLNVSDYSKETQSVSFTRAIPIDTFANIIAIGSDW